LARVGKNYDLMVDRREAIFRAILQARPGDVILIAGKGHETYQILPTGKIDFDDREVAREALAERKRLRNGGVRKNGGQERTRAERILNKRNDLLYLPTSFRSRK